MEKAAFESRAVLFGNVFGENVLVTNNRLLPGAPTMEIREVRENKKQFLELLLLADEEEAMIDRYLGRGTMYVLEDDGVKSECVVTDEGDGVLEIKNIATVPKHQGKGYARALIEHLTQTYRGRFAVLRVGTGESPATLPFYERLGFVRTRRIKNFFIDHYPHPIVEAGMRLVDMIVLERRL